MTLEKMKIGTVIPKNINVYYEDGIPYINYVGTTYVDGRKAEISIPKMDLNLVEINTYKETRYETRYEKRTGEITIPVTCCQNVYTVANTFFTVRFIDED